VCRERGAAVALKSGKIPEIVQDKDSSRARTQLKETNIASQQMARICVVIPVYNGCRFLRESIESVLAQTFGDFELVVVDDGSSDETWQILQSYDRDPRIKVIRFESNRGVSFAKNAGVANSDSEYIGFLDSDDLAKPNRLQIQCSFLDRNRRVDILHCRPSILVAGKETYPPLNRFPSDEIPPTLLFRNCVAQSSVLMRRACWQPFRSEFRLAEDYDLWARLAPNQVFAMQRCMLAVYREHQGGTSKLFAAKMQAAIREIFRFQLERLGVSPHIDLHCRLSCWPADADANDLVEAESWLNDLTSANKIYTPASFQRVIERVWYSICLDSWSLGPRAFEIYRRSSLGTLTPGRAWNFARRFGRRVLFG
jgi:glycosyltransferase involved in cell wall biosynthesis